MFENFFPLFGRSNHTGLSYERYIRPAIPGLPHCADLTPTWAWAKLERFMYQVNPSTIEAWIHLLLALLVVLVLLEVCEFVRAKYFTAVRDRIVYHGTASMVLVEGPGAVRQIVQTHLALGFEVRRCCTRSDKSNDVLLSMTTTMPDVVQEVITKKNKNKNNKNSNNNHVDVVMAVLQRNASSTTPGALGLVTIVQDRSCWMQGVPLPQETAKVDVTYYFVEDLQPVYEMLLTYTARTRLEAEQAAIATKDDANVGHEWLCDDTEEIAVPGAAWVVFRPVRTSATPKGLASSGELLVGMVPSSPASSLVVLGYVGGGVGVMNGKFLSVKM
eukprot:PhM_4_TR9190/c0_g1_i1/m.16034